MVYKYCFVLSCKNTTFTAPNKWFFRVPSEPLDVRKKWLKAAGRKCSLENMKKRSEYHCCEDHFNLEEDVENYMKCKIMGVKKMKMKRGVVPQKTPEPPATPRSAVLKRQRLQLISSALETHSQTVSTLPESERKRLVEEAMNEYQYSQKLSGSERLTLPETERKKLVEQAFHNTEKQPRRNNKPSSANRQKEESCSIKNTQDLTVPKEQVDGREVAGSVTLVRVPYQPLQEEPMLGEHFLVNHGSPPRQVQFDSDCTYFYPKQQPLEREAHWTYKVVPILHHFVNFNEQDIVSQLKTKCQDLKSQINDNANNSLEAPFETEPHEFEEHDGIENCLSVEVEEDPSGELK